MYNNIDSQITDLLYELSNTNCPSKEQLQCFFTANAPTLDILIYIHIPLIYKGHGMPSTIQWHIIRKLSQFNPGIALSYLAHSILATQTLIIHNQYQENGSIIDKLMQCNLLQ